MFYYGQNCEIQNGG
jgi:hypothetical protein